LELIPLFPGAVLLYYFTGVANETLVYALMIISFAALILSLSAARAADETTRQDLRARQFRQGTMSTHDTTAVTEPRLSRSARCPAATGAIPIAPPTLMITVGGIGTKPRYIDRSLRPREMLDVTISVDLCRD
jgi:hypothetical protein